MVRKVYEGKDRLGYDDKYVISPSEIMEAIKQGLDKNIAEEIFEKIRLVDDCNYLIRKICYYIMNNYKDIFVSEPISDLKNAIKTSEGVIHYLRVINSEIANRFFDDIKSSILNFEKYEDELNKLSSKYK